jgi:protein SCO1/2
MRCLSARVALSMIFSQSLARRRQRPSEAKVRSTTHLRGRTVTQAALENGPSLVFFGFTHCLDICPTSLFEVSRIDDALGPKADRLKTFFVTVDRDTPDLLKSYLSSFDPRIVGLTGERAAIEATPKAYRVFARKVPMDAGGYTPEGTNLLPPKLNGVTFGEPCREQRHLSRRSRRRRPGRAGIPGAPLTSRAAPGV